MNLRRVRLGEWVAGVSGVALLLALFLNWHNEHEAVVVETGDTATGVVAVPESVNAWESFAVLDVVLAITALAAIALVIVTAAQHTPAIPIAMASLLTLVSLVATIWVATDLISPGSEQIEGIKVDSGRLIGLWIGFLACAGVLAGSAWAMRDERPAFGMPSPWDAPDREPELPVATLPPPESR